MSRATLALATNQGLIYVLSMVVVGGLVGAGALGYDVVAGFSQRQLFGKGLAAGLAIVLLGIMLDRITQAAASRAERGTPTPAGTDTRPLATAQSIDGDGNPWRATQNGRFDRTETLDGAAAAAASWPGRSACSPRAAAPRSAAAAAAVSGGGAAQAVRHRQPRGQPLGRLRGRRGGRRLRR